MSEIEIWAGVESTINRVGDRYFSQCEKSGHDRRLSDLSLFAGLGVKKLRYPCLWEKVALDEEGSYNWDWTDERLSELQRLKIDPIAGLLHHGSGPRFTYLTEASFPEKFAAYARDFAQRYPWIEEYTPINEPLTTARFSCLYGRWFPHRRDDRSWALATYNQIRATVLAMREIRQVNPAARLVQTEDLGRAQSTEPLSLQRDFENDRRWLTYDMLCGKIERHHPLYKFLKQCGLTDAQMTWLRENPCPPDILGINHYPLSSRYLDHRLELYPKCYRGGNGKQAYADIGVVDVPDIEAPTPQSLLLETWERYKIPLAVSEVHVRGHREAQVSWLMKMWNAAEQARAGGADIRAVTVWSLLGSYDWNSLCTEDSGFYEPGVFDMQASGPRPTALSQMVKTIATQGSANHALFNRPILITGATGTLGRAFARICEARGIRHCLLSRAQMDIADPTSVEWALDVIRPWAVINAAGFVDVDRAEHEHERCFRENSAGPATLAQACVERALPFVTFSSDLVFDGEHEGLYTESHPVSPLSVYGHSKAESEKKVLAVHPNALVIRTSSFFGPWDQYNFVTQSLRRLAEKKELHVASDARVSPTYVPDLVNTTLDLLIDGERGLLHLTNEGQTSWAELARLAAGLSPSKVDSRLIVERPLHELKYTAPRPKHSALTSERMRFLPSLENALGRYFKQLEVQLNGELI